MMTKHQNTNCDYCGKDLSKGQNYLSMKNSICFYNWLEKQTRHSYLYLTQSSREDPKYQNLPIMDFCDVQCFGNWIEKRKKQAIQSLYNAYLSRVKEDSKAELEDFGIKESDLKEFGIEPD